MKKVKISLIAMLAMFAIMLTGCDTLSSIGGAGTSGREGGIGDTLSNVFFDFTVNSAEFVDELDGYTAEDGKKLLLLNVTIENVSYGDGLPMFDSDFQVYWDTSDDFAWSVDPFNETLMPLEFTLDAKEKATYDILFEVPADQDTFEFAYLEVYEDNDEGELYTVKFKV